MYKSLILSRGGDVIIVRNLLSQNFNSKMIKLRIMFAIIIFIATNPFSCKKDQISQNKIQIDIDENNKTKVNLESIINLETTPECLIGDVTRLSIVSDKIIILDRMYSKTLLMFNVKGKFNSKIKNGKGPGECFEPLDYYVDTFSNKLLVWDQGQRKLIQYDCDLHYNNERNYKNLIIRSFEKVFNDKWLVFARDVDPIELSNKDLVVYNYFVYSHDFSRIENKILPLRKDLANLSLASPISRSSKKIFSTQFNNSLYSLDEHGKVKVEFDLDFGKYNITKDDLDKGDDYIFQASREGERIISIDHLIYNDKYLAFTFVYKNEHKYLIHSNSTEKNYFSDNLFRSNILPKGVLMEMTSKGSFVLLVQPEHILEYLKNKKEYNEITNKIELQNNPIIVIFSIDEA